MQTLDHQTISEDNSAEWTATKNGVYICRKSEIMLYKNFSLLFYNILYVGICDYDV